jgi:hypothetical protein
MRNNNRIYRNIYGEPVNQFGEPVDEFGFTEKLRVTLGDLKLSTTLEEAEAKAMKNYEQFKDNNKQKGSRLASLFYIMHLVCL